jgi:cyclase
MRLRFRKPSLAAGTLFTSLLPGAAVAGGVGVVGVAAPPAPVPFSLRRTVIDERLSMVEAVDGFAGGNVLVSLGDDGPLLVDTMLADGAARLRELLRTLSTRPVRLVVDSHFHGDHAGGNAIFAADGAVVVAHRNTRVRLLAKARETATTAEGAPAITFDAPTTLHWNGDEVRLRHYPASHTDGDVVVHFTGSKVAHLGDLYFAGMFPAVYRAGGGDLRGLIATLNAILVDLPSDTKLVPGHGPLSSTADLRHYVAMLEDSVRRVDQAIAAGVSREAAIASRLLADYDVFGSGGAQTTDEFLTMLYELLSPSSHATGVAGE